MSSVESTFFGGQCRQQCKSNQELVSFESSVLIVKYHRLLSSIEYTFNDDVLKYFEPLNYIKKGLGLRKNAASLRTKGLKKLDCRQ
jgi:hypothetical protein